MRQTGGESLEWQDCDFQRRFGVNASVQKKKKGGSHLNENVTGRSCRKQVSFTLVLEYPADLYIDFSKSLSRTLRIFLI